MPRVLTPCSIITYNTNTAVEVPTMATATKAKTLKIHPLEDMPMYGR
jgi:hypothetical protein